MQKVEVGEMQTVKFDKVLVMKPIVFIQARMRSTCLPGKVLIKIYGQKPMVVFIYERVKSPDWHTVVLIPTTQDNDKLADLLRRKNIPFYRGSEDNVRQWFLDAWQCVGKPNTVVRITGDCPLVCREEITRLIKEHQKEKCYNIYLWNRDILPSGLDVEVFTGELLYNKDMEFKAREHVTPEMREEFLQETARQGEKFPDIKLSIDTAEDLLLVHDIMEGLLSDGISPEQCTMQELADFINRRYSYLLRKERKNARA